MVSNRSSKWSQNWGRFLEQAVYLFLIKGYKNGVLFLTPKAGHDMVYLLAGAVWQWHHTTRCEPQEAPEGFREPQEAPGGSRTRGSQEAPRGTRRPQKVPGGPWTLQKNPGGPRRPQREPEKWLPHLSISIYTAKLRMAPSSFVLMGMSYTDNRGNS